MVLIDVMDGSTEIGGNKIFIEHKGTRIDSIEKDSEEDVKEQNPR